MEDTPGLMGCLFHIEPLIYHKISFYFFFLVTRNIHGEIQYNSENRYYYESLFTDINESTNRIRIKGIIKKYVSPSQIIGETWRYLKYAKMTDRNRKPRTIRNFMIILSFLTIIVYLKILNLLKNIPLIRS